VRDEELIERLRHGYEALSRGELSEVLAMLDPAIELHERAEAPEAGVHHGHEGALHAFRQTDETFENYRIFPTRIELGPEDSDGLRRVVVVLHQEGEGRMTGVRVGDDLAHVLTLHDGRAIMLQVFSTPEEARAAAGIAA
jgi:ketosteroid isomerase-like protein